IDAAVNDVAFFRVTTPPPPRDLMAIEITNHSTTLAPVLKLFDDERRITNWGKIVHEPGANLRQIVALPPNTTFYLQVSGYGSSAGAYTLLFQPLKAFDSYEPNDDIYHAPRIALGTTIMAGIMEADDTDYYSFVSPRTGTVSVLITNRSTTLIPALSTFDPDMRSSGFGPDVRTPGRNLRHTMEVQQNQVYFIQVWSQANTGGGLLVNCRVTVGQASWPVAMGIPPAKLHEKPAEANKSGTQGEQKAGFFDPVCAQSTLFTGSPMWYGMAEWNSSQNSIPVPKRPSIANCQTRLPCKSAPAY